MMLDKKKRKKYSLAFVICGLVMVSIILSVTIQVFASYQATKSMLYRTTLDLNYSKAVKMSETMDSLFKAMNSTLNSTSNYLAKQDNITPTMQQSYLDLVRNSNNYFNSLFVVDATGAMSNVSPASIVPAGTKISTVPTQTALRERKPYMSSPYVGSTNRLIILMTQPIFDSSGNYLGYVGGTIYLREPNILFEIFGSSITGEKEDYFYVVSDKGELIYHPEKHRLGENVSANVVVSKLLQGESGKQQVTNTKGTKQLAGFAYVTSNKWGIIVQSPLTDVNANLQHLVLNQVMYAAPLLIIMLIGGFLLAKRLVKPFAFLADIAFSYSNGEKLPIPKFRSHWNKEAHALNQAMHMAIHTLAKQTTQLSLAASTDSLTGLTNRRTMEIAVSQFIEEQKTFSLLILDMDHFKAINDTFGHQTGDDVLKQLSEIMKSSVRPSDICCRYGGEEFVILLLGSTAESTYEVAERIRKNVESMPSPTGSYNTISIGICEFPTQASTRDELFEKADKALYAAKREGRNKTKLAK